MKLNCKHIQISATLCAPAALVLSLSLSQVWSGLVWSGLATVLVFVLLYLVIRAILASIACRLSMLLSQSNVFTFLLRIIPCISVMSCIQIAEINYKNHPISSDQKEPQEPKWIILWDAAE